MDNHRLHNYEETEVLVSKRSAAVNDLLETAESLLSKDEGEVKFSDMKGKLAAYHKELIVALRNQFQSVRKQVTDRENYLLTCLQIMVERENVEIEDTEKEFKQLILSFQSVIAAGRKVLKEPKSVSLITEGKQLSRDLEANIESMSKVCDLSVVKDQSVQLIFADEDRKAVTACVDKLGTLVHANQPPSKTDHTKPRKLSKNMSLPAISVHSNKTSALDYNETTSVTLQPAAVISCTEKGKKFYPCGIAVGSNNLITVSDLHNNFVKVLTGTGKVIDTIESGKGSFTLKGPCALDVEANDIYILERENKSIGKYTNGSLIDLGKFKQFSDPRGILVCKEKVYITDLEKNCIHVLTLTCNRLSYQSTIGESYLKQPSGITCDNNSEKLVVCDQESHCVWVLTLNGDVVNVIGEKGTALGQLNVPYGVAVTGDGKVVVSERGSCRISAFSLHGSHLFSFGSKGSDPGQFNQLRHICTNFNKQILVADELNQRVQIFDI